MIGLLIALVPTDFERRLRPARRRGGWLARWRSGWRRCPPPSRPACATRSTTCARATRRSLGAVGYWAFNIAVLWACFHAFGERAAVGGARHGFFVGMLGNLLPLPGGVGGVDGGMIGAFAAFGVDAGLAVVAVLTYRAFAFWLPTIPGRRSRTSSCARRVEALAIASGRRARTTIQTEVSKVTPEADANRGMAEQSRTSSSSAAARPATPPRCTRRAPTCIRS